MVLADKVLLPWLLAAVVFVTTAHAGVFQDPKEFCSADGCNFGTKEEHPALSKVIEICDVEEIADAWFLLGMELFPDESYVLAHYQSGARETANKDNCLSVVMRWNAREDASWSKLAKAVKVLMDKDIITNNTAIYDELLQRAEDATIVQDAFSLASYYGDHMVLQMAPQQSSIWGYLRDSYVGSQVTCELSGKQYAAVITTDSTTQTRWKVLFDPVEAGGPYTITCTAGDKTITISDVLFGDVWICSGQSNMAFNVQMMMLHGAGVTVLDSHKYPNVRVFTSDTGTAYLPQRDLPNTREVWSVGGPDAIGHKRPFSYFSAVCWFYGRELYKKFNYPIGLVSSAYPGTPVEAWSSPKVLKSCGTDLPINPILPQWRPSSLWNAMMHPLLDMTIRGVAWYQGEQNAAKPDHYACLFSTMIDDWRSHFYRATDKQTDPMFPFGFVQLSTGTEQHDIDKKGFPEIRWHQTADYGYAPNPRQQNVFMAVAMDLEDPGSIWGPMHPRTKEEVGTRFSLAARAIAYGDSTVYYSGPIAVDATITDADTITIKYDQLKDNTLELRSNAGFQIYCVGDTDDKWIDATITQAVSDTVTITGACDAGYYRNKIRYAWYDNPCEYQKCAVYSGDLPSPPFEMDLYNYVQLT